jgi:hypothetical protein
MCTAYLTFERARQAALRVGPTDEQIAAAAEDLKADDDTLLDTLGYLEYEQIKRQLGAAVRGDDADAIAFVKEFRLLVDAAIHPWAEAAAREALERSWNEGAEALAGVC